ncbi:hypothetical protein GGI08_003192 [Coemansia sp. S2]|nr:hypothetical protein GGI08_003192 [Coemansia sp. S2]KAJ2337851.1 hypothetical protein GGH92_007425 [Coemansia sp. RSA 2673]
MNAPQHAQTHKNQENIPDYKLGEFHCRFAEQPNNEPFVVYCVAVDHLPRDAWDYIADIIHTFALANNTQVCMATAAVFIELLTFVREIGKQPWGLPIPHKSFSPLEEERKELGHPGLQDAGICYCLPLVDAAAHIGLDEYVTAQVVDGPGLGSKHSAHGADNSVGVY